MNILISSASYILSDHLAGGENRIVWGIIKELDRRGHRLFVFAPKCDIHTSLPNTRFYELGGYRFEPERDYFRYKADWWLYNVRAYLEARRLLKTERIDLIHHIMPGYLGRFSLPSLLPPPFVYGPITPIWEGTSEQDRDTVPEGRRVPWKSLVLRPFLIFEKLAGPAAWNATLEQSDMILLQLPKSLEGLPSTVHHKTQIIGLGLDIGNFRPSPESFGRPTILFLARLLRRKGLEYLLRAMPRTIDVIPHVCLKVVGDGPARSFFEEIAKSLNLCSHVEFVGTVPHDDTVPFFQKSHVYCLPSFGEPAANTLIEAMACGLPIISTVAGGVPDFVEDGKSGFLVPPRDSEALAEASCKLLEDPTLCREMGVYNRKQAEEVHDIRRLVDRIEAAYSKVAQN